MTINKSTPPSFSIVIVSWNVAPELSKCLKSIVATKYPAKIIVIDNASSDNTLAVANSFAQVTVISNSTNLGFPVGVNMGLKLCNSDYVMLLNPDTQIPKDFFIKSIKFFSSHPDAGVMGPLFLNPDGSPQGSVFPEPSIVDTFKEFWLGKTGLTSKYVPVTNNSEPVIVNAISGGCMVFPRDELKDVGPLTEKVFMFYEDMDYCRRIRAFGKKIYFNPSITIIHEHGSSSKQSAKSNPNQLPFWKGYLWQSSLWYNGPLKHYLMSAISWTGQKLHSYDK